MTKMQSYSPKPKGAREKPQSKFPLPEAIELAKLAAILKPGLAPAGAMKAAMQFYVEAVLFLRDLPASLDELVKQFGSRERKRAPIRHDIARYFANTLELDPQADDDEVRRYFSKHGLIWKQPRTVLKNIRLHAREAESLLAQSKREKDGRTIYAFLRHTLEVVAQCAKQSRSDSKRAAWKTRQKNRLSSLR